MFGLRIAAVVGILILLCICCLVAVTVWPLGWIVDRWRERRRRRLSLAQIDLTPRQWSRLDEKGKRAIRNATPEQWDRLLNAVLRGDPELEGDELAVRERPDRFEME